MHKKHLYLIIAPLLLTSANAAELYGSIELGMTSAYNHNPAEGNMTFIQVGENAQGQAIYKAYRSGKQGLAIEDYGSYIGLRGNEDLGENIRLIYDLKWAFNGANGGDFGEGFENEIAKIGLQTQWGTIAIGRLENPFYDTVKADSVSDDFNALGYSASAAAAGEIFSGNAGSINTFDADMWEYLGSAASYTSPTIAGLTFTASMVASTDEEIYGNNRYVDLYTLGLAYEHDSGFYLRLGYLSADLDEDAKRAYSYGVAVGFRTEDWGITGNYAYSKNRSAKSLGAGNAHSEFFWDHVSDQIINGSENSYKHTANGWDIGAYWAFGDDHNTTLRATYGQAKSTKRHASTASLGRMSLNTRNAEENRLRTWSLGAEQALSEHTAIWLEYEHSLVKQKFATSGINLGYIDQSLNNKKFRDNRASIGIRHDF